MKLPRLQLFEFNDLPWVPASVRDTIVESLSRTLEWGRILDGLVPTFERFLDEAGTRELLDLGSGAGGPARILASSFARAGKRPPHFLLTDLHPRPGVWAELAREQPGVVDFVEAPVDATNIDPTLAEGRARTIINVLHHLPPELARGVFADAVRHGRGIFVAEGFERRPEMFVNFGAAGIPALALNPLLSKKDRLEKAALTWLTPAAISIAIWDGLVSTLRVYDEAELRAMVAPLGDHFRWEYGTYPYPPLGRGYYFYGVPRR